MEAPMKATSGSERSFLAPRSERPSKRGARCPASGRSGKGAEVVWPRPGWHRARCLSVLCPLLALCSAPLRGLRGQSLRKPCQGPATLSNTETGRENTAVQPKSWLLTSCFLRPCARQWPCVPRCRLRQPGAATAPKVTKKGCSSCLCHHRLRLSFTHQRKRIT